MRETIFAPLDRLARGIMKVAQLMVGVPDYEAYVAHRNQSHPDEPVMSYEDFFRERQANRYGEGSGKINRCC
jgi:uncharacterized short protein YbdD (DUF466 family)